MCLLGVIIFSLLFDLIKNISAKIALFKFYFFMYLANCARYQYCLTCLREGYSFKNVNLIKYKMANLRPLLTLPFESISAAIAVFNLFYLLIKSLILGIEKCQHMVIKFKMGNYWLLFTLIWVIFG